jgi:drug/metabolite transporter (DMT)-like permease
MDDMPILLSAWSSRLEPSASTRDLERLTEAARLLGWRVYPLPVEFTAEVGTLAAFGLYFASLRHIAPTDAAIAVTVEPMTAALASLVVLHVALHPAQYIGGGLILGAVVLLRREG